MGLTAPGFLQFMLPSREEPRLDGVLAALALDADLILVEGYKSRSLPKIAIVELHLEEVLHDYSHVIALVSIDSIPSTLTVFHPEEVAALESFIQDYCNAVPEANNSLKGQPFNCSEKKPYNRKVSSNF